MIVCVVIEISTIQPQILTFCFEMSTVYRPPVGLGLPIRLCLL